MHPPNKGCVIHDQTMRLTESDEYVLNSEVHITRGLYGMHPNMFPRQLAPKTSRFKLDRHSLHQKLVASIELFLFVCNFLTLKT